jgi:hypothetical protein
LVDLTGSPEHCRDMVACAPESHRHIEMPHDGRHSLRHIVDDASQQEIGARRRRLQSPATAVSQEQAVEQLWVRHVGAFRLGSI